jgi:hypothetical protein
LLFGLLTHNLLETNLAEDFHGALAGLRGAGMDGSAAMVFHGQRTDAVESEQHGGRQTNQAAADDENRNFDISHGYSAS